LGLNVTDDALRALARQVDGNVGDVVEIDEPLGKAAQRLVASEESAIFG
jgi:hypothetical protein